VIPMTTVTGFSQRPDGTWEVETVRTGRWARKSRRTFTARHLILAAGTWGTQKLLFKMRDSGTLPKLSDKLGVLTRTNSESIVGAGRMEARPDLDLTHGVAITSSIHPTPDTHVEPCRYGKGSNAMGPAADADDRRPRPGRFGRAALEAVVHQRRPGSARHAAHAQSAALERAHDDLAGDAAPGQLDHHLHQEGRAGRTPDDQQAGPRRAQPDVDPGRQRSHPADRREDRRRRGRNLGSCSTSR
jgi:choline dehydrogenase-like flavoprotein